MPSTKKATEPKPQPEPELKAPCPIPGTSPDCELAAINPLTPDHRDRRVNQHCPGCGREQWNPAIGTRNLHTPTETPNDQQAPTDDD